MIEYRRALPEVVSHDVVVCGEGRAGCAAALSARRKGLRVLLLESQGQLGGMATGGHVSQLLGGRTQEGAAVITRLEPEKRYHPYGWIRWFAHGISVEPFRFAAFQDRAMRRAGVEVLLNTVLVSDLAVGADGSLYMPDAANHRILRLIPR